MSETRFPLSQALGLATAGLVALAFAGVMQPVRFLPAYLYAYLFWLGISLGALSLYMISRITGGHWGEVTAPPFLAAGGVLPVLTLLFLPVAFGMPVLYPWIEGQGAEAGLLAHKAPYLNAGFFLLRAALYFAVWLTLAWLLQRWAPPGIAPTRARFVRRLSALGLVLYALTGTFAVIDWLMSLMPSWYSTVFGAEVLVTQLLQGACLGVLVVGAAAGWRATQAIGRDLHALGNLMLLFTLLWAYLAFSDFLTIWIADLPQETQWYLPRMRAPWGWIGPLLALLLFAVPFTALLFKSVKLNARALALVALVVLAGTLLNAYWLTVPSVPTRPPGLHWLDAFTPLALGAVWVGFFRVRQQLQSKSQQAWGQA